MTKIWINQKKSLFLQHEKKDLLLDGLDFLDWRCTTSDGSDC